MYNTCLPIHALFPFACAHVPSRVKAWLNGLKGGGTAIGMKELLALSDRSKIIVGTHLQLLSFEDQGKEVLQERMVKAV